MNMMAHESSQYKDHGPKGACQVRFIYAMPCFALEQNKIPRILHSAAPAPGQTQACIKRKQGLGFSCVDEEKPTAVAQRRVVEHAGLIHELYHIDIHSILPQLYGLLVFHSLGPLNALLNFLALLSWSLSLSLKTFLYPSASSSRQQKAFLCQQKFGLKSAARFCFGKTSTDRRQRWLGSKVFSYHCDFNIQIAWK